MNLPKLSVTRRVTVTMLILVLVLFGGLSFTQLGLDMMPDMEIPMLIVATPYPGAAAEDVEQLVTRPVESAVAGIKGIDKLTSTSAEGLSTVTIMFDWGADLDIAANDIRENISRIKNYLPDDIIDPMVLKFDMSQMPVLMYGVSGMNSPMELQKYFEDAVVPRIERLAGVATMTVVGGPVREINVFLNKTRLDQYRIGPDAVMGVLAASNMNLSSGYVTAGHQEYMVRTMGEFRSVEQISNTIITTLPDGSPIRISDVARVEDTQKEQRNYMRLNDAPGVMFFVTKQSGENTLATTKRVKEELEKLKEHMPGDIKYVPVFDQGEMVEHVVNNSVESAVIGAALAVFILLLFLRNWRPTFVIALAIPISVLTTFIGMYALGYTFNIITIGGFALAVGMLVDNAVVVIENIYRHLEEGKHRNEAAVIGASEVGLAIGASTLTTVAVFVPLALAGGFAGIFARPLALTVCAGLFASLLVAVTIVPMLASTIFKKRSAKQARNGNAAGAAGGDDDVVDTSDAGFQAEAHGGRLFQAVQRGYEGALGWVLSHRVITVLVTLGLLGAAVYAFTKVGMEFMAEGDGGMGYMTIKLPVGTNLEETDRLVRTIEERVLSLPELESAVAVVGPMSEDSDGGGPTDVNEAMLYFRLKPFAERERSTKQIMSEIRLAIPELHDVEIQLASMAGMGASSTPIELKFFGNDLGALKSYAEQAKAIMDTISAIKTVKGVADTGKALHDVVVSMREGKPELRIIPDRDRASMMGFTMAEIGTGLRYANFGNVVTRYREAGEEYDIRVRLDEEDRTTKEQVTSIPIISRTGVVTQAANLGDVEYTSGPINIKRENRVRVVSVTAQTDSRDLQGEVTKIKTALKDMEAAMPNGYFVEYGGSFEDMQETFADLLLALIVAVILIYMVMAAQFESFTQPVIVMATVPLAFIGVSFGLLVMGHPLSVSGFMGVIVLIGIVVNNGIIMITFVNQLRGEGHNMRGALIKGAGLRLRPILITTLTTVAGMAPMAFSTGQGSEMQAPLGIAVTFGLASSMVMTLFVVPVIYSIVDGVAHGITAFMKRVVLGEGHKVREKLS